MALKIYKKGAYVVINNSGKLTELNSAEVSITKDTEAIDIYEVKHNGVPVLKAQLSDIQDESGVAYVEAVWDAFRYEQTGTTNTGTGVTSAAGVTYDNATSGLTATDVKGAIDEVVASAPVASYKVYAALLTQTGTSAPTATILENTLSGTPIWSYSGIGDYTATLTGAFTVNKTAIIIGNKYQSLSAVQLTPADIMVGSNDVNTFYVDSITNAALANDLISGLYIEVRVYN